jgi:hypothetical protein
MKLGKLLLREEEETKAQPFSAKEIRCALVDLFAADDFVPEVLRSVMQTGAHLADDFV